MTHRVPADRLPTPMLMAFAVGSIGTGLFSTVPTVLLLFYCTETLGIAASTASVILIVPKLWCLFWDPFVGRWSDRMQSRWGRRAPFLAAGAFGTAAAFVTLFHAPSGSKGVALYVGVAYFLATALYTLFSVPYIAVPAEISALPDERERAIAWRMPCMMTGVLLGAAAAPHLVAIGGGGAVGYAAMAWVIASVSLGGMLASAFAVRRLASGTSPSVSQAGPSPLRHAPFRRLLLAYMMQMCAVAYVFAAVPYLATQVLHAPPEAAGTLLGALLLSSIVAMPLWTVVARRVGVARSLNIATILLVVALAGLMMLRHGELSGLAIVVFGALGIPMAALQLLPFMMLAHVINAYGRSNGSRREGAFTGLFIAAEKVALASGPALVGLGLTLLGHVGGGIKDADDVGGGILLLAVAVPAALGLTSAAVGRLAPLAPREAAP